MIQNTNYLTLHAIVLRAVAYKEDSRILTLLTDAHGKLTVSAPGAMKKNSRVAPSVQPLAFSEMTLSRTRDRWNLMEAHPVEQFLGLTEDLTRFALGAYFAELLENLADEDSPGPAMLSLALNALYVLAEGKKPVTLIKSAFETRLMCLAGFAPDLRAPCRVCGQSAGEKLDLEGGVLLCNACAARTSAQLERLTPTVLDALRHITSCEPKRLYAFTLEETGKTRAPAPMRQLAAVSEAYLLAQLDRGFRTLDYYHAVKNA
ncbi:MAG: DNA repair protein RecO [Oscillospiraceae bacterium]|jgi:DNA repair protein RecO (recombination protein O)|nr:DNA repair protein RecO [Oscillospiraceae bacterium]